jgi:hypothetical protein
MSNALARLLRTGLLLAPALAIALLAGPRSAADDVDSREFRGACYCRAQSELMCTANLTARECDRRSKLALCDDWFWKERLACWNWGYGG